LVLKLLAKDGIDPDSKGSDGQTPLHWAARNGHEAVVKLLVEKGAELETKDKSGRTPLSLAAACYLVPTITATVAALGAV
jgi:ankyrin repeat protein